MKGRIDEVGFWKRVLTSAERSLLYNGGVGLTYPFSGAPTPTRTPTVVAQPPLFVERDGIVVMEAEDYNLTIPRSGDSWVLHTDVAGYVGGGSLRAEPDGSPTIDTGYLTTSPELQYRVQFATTGTYYVWLRVRAPDTYGNSAHAGLDGVGPASADRLNTTSFNSWVWTRDTIDAVPATLSITSTGIHTIHLWMREDGLYVDRLILTTDAGYTPSGSGPAEGLIATATPTATWTPSPTASYTPTVSPTPTSTPSSPPPPPSGQVWTQYYLEGGQRIAMRVRDGARNDLYFLLPDHLGTTALTVTENGQVFGEMRYMPWGETRYTSGSTPSDYRYTGQREEAGIGLYYYNARWYDPALGRFAQADTIVPGGGNPMAWDGYAYAANSPLRYVDPTGHWEDEGCTGASLCNLPGPKAMLEQVAEPRGTKLAGDETSGPITEFLLAIPGTAEFYSGLGTGLDIVALLFDLYAAGVVTYGGIAGAGIAAPFAVGGAPEVPLATGAAGAAIAELAVQRVLGIGNLAATASTAATLISETKAGNTRVEEGLLSVKLANSATLTTIGWINKEAYISLVWQSLAVANDFGWTSLPWD